jgi:hypothetical protein
VTLGNQGAAAWSWGEPPPAAGGELLLVESFEGDFMPPPGWQRLTLQPAASWQLSPGSGHAGTQAALVPGADSAQDEWLLSPPLWLQRGWLTLWTWGSASTCRGSARCDLEVYILGEGIGTVLLGSAEAAWLADGSWTAHAWELTPHLPATGAVQIGIRYRGQPGSATARIDDVVVSGLARPEGCREPAAPWLTATIPVAPLAPGARAVLSLTLDARSLAASSYTSALCLPGNDPRAPLWPLPVTLNVDGCAAVPPPAPTLAIHQGLNGSAVLSWPAEDGQAAYRLFRGRRPADETLWLELPAGAENALDLAPGSAAFYRLEAGNCSGDYWAGSNRVGWMVFSLHRD